MMMPAQEFLKNCGSKKILFLMAAKSEYGPQLQKLFMPVFIGIGPVEAAVQTTAILGRLQQEGALPDLVVSLGSAGAQNLYQTEIYQVSSVSWRDMDATFLGFAKGVTPFLDLPATLPMPCLLPNVPTASLSTGANIVSGSAYDAIATDMVDMETYAVLRACQNFSVPLIGFRGISDGCEELSHINDWQQYLHIIDEKLANIIIELEQTIVQPSFSLTH